MQKIAEIKLASTRPHRTSGAALVLILLGVCLIVYLVGPLLYFLAYLPWPTLGTTLNDPDAWNALGISVISATISLVLMGLFGIPLGYLLARYTFPGKTLINLAIYLPIVFPPVVSGIVLLILFGPYGPIGGPLTNIGLELDDSVAGIVLAQIFVAAPFVIVAARTAFEAIDPKLEQVAATLGHRRWSLFWRVSLPLARGGILAGLILAWMRALGEFGATVIMAYHPYTLPVYTYVALTGFGVASSIPLALLSLGVSGIVIGLIMFVQRRFGGPVSL
jgi:molybdate/tungstate transport system permease protein